MICILCGIIEVDDQLILHTKILKRFYVSNKVKLDDSGGTTKYRQGGGWKVDIKKLYLKVEFETSWMIRILHNVLQCTTIYT